MFCGCDRGLRNPVASSMKLYIQRATRQSISAYEAKNQVGYTNIEGVREVMEMDFHNRSCERGGGKQEYISTAVKLFKADTMERKQQAKSGAQSALFGSVNFTALLTKYAAAGSYIWKKKMYSATNKTRGLYCIMRDLSTLTVSCYRRRWHAKLLDMPKKSGIKGNEVRLCVTVEHEKEQQLYDGNEAWSDKNLQLV